MTITDIVRDNNMARFSFFRNGILFYETTVAGQKYMFPVNPETLDGASVFAEMKAIHLIPYLRKALAEETFVKTR